MFFSAVDCISKASLFLLSDIADVCQVGDFPDFCKPQVLARFLQGVFEFVGFVEVVFNRSFVLPVTIRISSIPEAIAFQ